MRGEGNPGGRPREDTAHFRIYHTFSWQSAVIIISKEDYSLGAFFCCCSFIWNILLCLLILFTFLCLYEIKWISSLSQSWRRALVQDYVVCVCSVALVGEVSTGPICPWGAVAATTLVGSGAGDGGARAGARCDPVCDTRQSPPWVGMQQGLKALGLHFCAGFTFSPLSTLG